MPKRGAVTITTRTARSDDTGSKGALSKPYRRSELLDRVRQALNDRGSGQER